MNLFDIGTNHGRFTKEYLQLYPDAKIVCVEANQHLYDGLVEEFKHNNNVLIYHNLVSDTSTKLIDFHLNQTYDGVSTASKDWVENSRFKYTDWVDIVQVESITLDKLIEQTFIPDMIKIDVEGYENTVIKGLTKKVDLLQFEWSEEIIDSVKDTCQYLQSIGYSEFAYKFEDLPYSYLPNIFTSLDNLGLFEQLIPERKEKWGMIYTR